jgi:CHAT domain-containing protein
VAAELARTLVALATAIEIGATAEPGPSGAPLAPGDVAARAEDLARRAVAAAPQGAPEAADAAYALGAALWARSDLDGAVEWLSRSEDPGARWLWARALATRYDVAGNAADLDAARELLDAAARDELAPREAFEAARFRGFWAAQRDDWDEAADAWLLALGLRERLRRAQREELRERQWLLEAGRLPSLAADALVRASRSAEAVGALDAALFTEIADRLGSPQTPALEGFAAIAGWAATEPLVYLVVTPDCGQALIVADGAVRAVELEELNGDELHDQLVAYATLYRRWQATQSPEGFARWTDQLERVSAWLWPAVMEPVLDALPAGTTAVTVIPDGMIGLLPLHAAGDALDRVRVRFAPNASALARSARAADAGGALVAAAPAVPDLTPLPYAAAEAHAVAALLPAPVVLVGPEAGVEAVESSLAGCAVVHFACHAMTRFDDPGASALTLGDGRQLTLARMLSLELPDTRLAVLSACESAMPEVIVPEEKTSLAAGLMLAGVAGVVASLWAVGDQSTMLLVTRLHELRARGAGACSALHEAQRWLRDSTATALGQWAGERADEMARAGAPEADVARMAAAVEGLGDEERPFAARYHWAGFTYIGA